MDTPRLISLLNVSALVTMMLSMGLQVSLRDLLASARPMRLLVLGLLANYVFVPAVTVGLLNLFQANPMVSAGFLILSVCPGASVGPPITSVARGNVPCAIGMMLILAGLSVLFTPPLLSALLARVAANRDLHVDTTTIVRILLITRLLPLLLGLGIHQGAPRMARRLVRPVGLLANGLLLVTVGLIVATQSESLLAIRPRGWIGMGLLLLAGLGIGWSCGGPGAATRKAMAAITATRNVAVGLVIVANNFAGTPAVTAVAAYGLVSIGGTLVWALMVGKFAAGEQESPSVGS